MAIATGINITLAAILTIAIVASAYNLQQVRDLLCDIRETQKKLASRFGVAKL